LLINAADALQAVVEESTMHTSPVEPVGPVASPAEPASHAAKIARANGHAAHFMDCSLLGLFFATLSLRMFLLIVATLFSPGILQAMVRAFFLLLVLSACGPQLDDKSCPFTVDSSWVQGKNLRCGYVSTFENPEKRAGARVRVPVLVFKSLQKNTREPLFFLAGGPSQSWANLGLEQLTAAAFENADRDYVFVEQRGTGKSLPALLCGDSSPSDCAAVLSGQGIDVASYDTFALASDVDLVRRALGYDKVVLIGTSYGTTWARAVLALYPEGVRAAVLDSVVAATFPALTHFASATNVAFNAAFSGCRDDLACNSFVPDLGQTFARTITALAATPLVDSQGKTALGAPEFVFAARDLLASRPGLVPTFIESIAEALPTGRLPLSIQKTATSSAISTRTGEAEGQYYSVFCADNTGVTDDDIRSDLALVTPALQPILGDVAFALRQICDAWPHADARFDSASYAGPVLLLAGQFDPRTPPAWARDALTKLPGGQLLVVPGVGHDVQGAGLDCVSQILRGFLTNNYILPDTACIAGVSTHFVTQVIARDDIPLRIRADLSPSDLVRLMLDRPLPFQ
jgi:pimeloyl-ACP methyl ester carboxylesterase